MKKKAGWKSLDLKASEENQRRRKASRARPFHRDRQSDGTVALNAIRWCNNILVEILANQVGPNFSMSRDKLSSIVQQMEELNRTLYFEINKSGENDDP